ncbi:MAG: hypothetical protein ACRDTD_06580, partial [Pseudonocardiaceae bacterium]
MNGYESLEDALEVLERASDMDGPDVSEEEEAYFDEAGWADADEPTSPAADRPESDQRSAFAALHGALGTATIFSEQAAKLAGHQALVRNVDHIFEHIDRARRDGLLSPEEAGELTRAAIRGLVRKPGPGEKPSANEPAVPELLDWGLQKAEISLAGESDQPPQSLAHWDTVNLPMPASAAPSVPIMAAIPSEALEVRPPGRGEASAFDRRQELIDRMNMQSAAISYRLDGCTIVYQVLDDTRFNNFDRQMMRLIDLA